MELELECDELEARFFLCFLCFLCFLRFRSFSFFSCVTTRAWARH